MPEKYKKAPPDGLLKWYNALHIVTSDMAHADWTKGTAQPKATLKDWSDKLKNITKEIDTEAKKKRKS